MSLPVEQPNARTRAAAAEQLRELRKPRRYVNMDLLLTFRIPTPKQEPESKPEQEPEPKPA